MADACEVPLVVHGDDNGLACMHHFVDVCQRQETLIDPMQMDDIRSLELAEFRDVCSGIGDIDLEEILPAEVVGNEDAEAFPNEFERLHPVVSYGEYSQVVGLLVAHQHFHLDTILLQGFHQSIGCNGSTSATLRCVDNEYSHFCKIGCKGSEELGIRN